MLRLPTPRRRRLRGQRLPKRDPLRLSRGLVGRLPGPHWGGRLTVSQRQASRPHRRCGWHQGGQRVNADKQGGQRGRFGPCAAATPPVAPRFAAAERRIGAWRVHGRVALGRIHARLQRLMTPTTQAKLPAAFAPSVPPAGYPKSGFYGQSVLELKMCK